MEFFAEIKNTKLDVASLQQRLSIKQLPALCQSIDSVLIDNIESGRIYCTWGEFDINREEISYGVRFTLPHCLNTIAWTITLNESSNEIVIHCSMNKKQHDAGFIESIEQFVADWAIA